MTKEMEEALNEENDEISDDRALDTLESDNTCVDGCPLVPTTGQEVSNHRLYA